MEIITRCLNNLSERLHHHTWLYISADNDTAIPVTKYLLPLALCSISPVLAVSLLVDMQAITEQFNSHKFFKNFCSSSLTAVKNFTPKGQILIKNPPPENPEYTNSTFPIYFAITATIIEIAISLAVYSSIPVAYKLLSEKTTALVLALSHLTAVLLTSLVLLPALWKIMTGLKSRSKRKIFITIRRLISTKLFLVIPVQLCLSVPNPSISILIALCLYPCLILPLPQKKLSSIVCTAVFNPTVIVYAVVSPLGLTRLADILHDLLWTHTVFSSPIPLLILILVTPLSISSIFCQYLRLISADKKKIE